MRIVFVVHTFFPNWQAGTEVYARSLARKAIASGHDARIVCYEPPSPDWEFFAGLKTWDTTVDGIPVHRISFFKTHRVFHFKDYFHPGVFEHLTHYLAAIQPDVVHIVHAMHLSTAAIWAAKMLGLPVVATATDFWYACPTYQFVKHDESLCRRPDPISCLACLSSAQPGTRLDSLARRIWLSRVICPGLLFLAQLRLLPSAASDLVIWLWARPGWMRKTLAQVDVLLAPTPNTAQLLSENGLTAITVRTCGFGLEKHSSTVQPRKADSILRLGYIGTFRQSKGVHVLLEAVRQLPAERIRLDLYGKIGQFPEYDRRLFELAKGLPNVEFRGTFPNEKLPEVFAGFDALVMPALWYENSPLVLLSSFAQKVPVVASRVGSLADLVVHRKNGLLFEMGDPSSLVAQIRRLLDDPALISQLRSGIPEVKTVDENAAELFDLYEEVLTKARNRPQQHLRIPPALPHLSLARGLLGKRMGLAHFGAQFGSGLSLLTCRVVTNGGRGVRFDLRWHSRQPESESVVFLHLVDEQNRICIQADHPLSQYNQDPWGFITYSVEVPSLSFHPDKSYSVRLGVWNPNTAERLPVIRTRGMRIDTVESAIKLDDIRLK
jgi:glycosyltransferase involved in cell wall biosynthesis